MAKLLSLQQLYFCLPIHSIKNKQCY